MKLKPILESWRDYDEAAYREKYNRGEYSDPFRVELEVERGDDAFYVTVVGQLTTQYDIDNDEKEYVAVPTEARTADGEPFDVSTFTENELEQIREYAMDQLVPRKQLRFR